jgi:hypothetical protein
MHIVQSYCREADSRSADKSTEPVLEFLSLSPCAQESVRGGPYGEALKSSPCSHNLFLQI